MVMTCLSICTTHKAGWRDRSSRNISDLDPGSGPQLNGLCPAPPHSWECERFDVRGALMCRVWEGPLLYDLCLCKAALIVTQSERWSKMNQLCLQRKRNHHICKNHSRLPRRGWQEAPGCSLWSPDLPGTHRAASAALKLEQSYCLLWNCD